ncbi:hypothetical protein QBC39DRAFT_398661 [Podospora conica]|nr:hypothetical protein QBC39DRAFT_398661 [Schizothecium conicum]
MARRQSPLSRIAALSAVALLFSAQNVAAGPYPKDDLHAAGYGYLMPRQCNQYCGLDNQYCCNAGSTCLTVAGIATCSPAGNAGGFVVYTTTWTQAATYTSTYSSYFPAFTGNGNSCIPVEGSGQSACGPICCAKDQYCAYNGQCLMGSGGGLVQTTVTSGGLVFTTQFSAPYRVTSGTGTLTGVPAGATTTGAGGATPEESTDGGGLSPGAIAGIVIGTIAGIILLLLLCFCCVVRGLWHGVMAILGLGKKKETVIEEERYRRSSSRHSGRDAHGAWYGGAAGGGRPGTVSGRKEKKSEGKGLLGLGAALGTLWLLLGLKKDKKGKKSTKSRSDVSSSYYSDSYTGESPSSMSSDRRTRRSRRSGTQVSRTSRVTRTTRVSRAPSGASRHSPRD